MTRAYVYIVSFRFSLYWVLLPFREIIHEFNLLPAFIYVWWSPNKNKAGTRLNALEFLLWKTVPYKERGSAHKYLFIFIPERVLTWTVHILRQFYYLLTLFSLPISVDQRWISRHCETEQASNSSGVSYTWDEFCTFRVLWQYTAPLCQISSLAAWLINP